ncbi:UNVERIFIED_CONTAM: hypothetical protein K2H54_027067 [Gekko kuhli]
MDKYHGVDTRCHHQWCVSEHDLHNLNPEWKKDAKIVPLEGQMSNKAHSARPGKVFAGTPELSTLRETRGKKSPYEGTVPERECSWPGLLCKVGLDVRSATRCPGAQTDAHVTLPVSPLKIHLRLEHGLSSDFCNPLIVVRESV